jgi:putative acetyltransferase
MPFDLRPLSLRDAPALRDLLTQPDVAPELPWVHPGLNVKAVEAELSETDPFRLALGHFEGGVLVAAGALRGAPQARKRHAATAWVAVRGPHRRRGLGRAVLAALLGQGERWLRLDRVELAFPAAAPGAAALLQGLGLAREAVKRSAVFRAGALADVEVWSWVKPGGPACGPPPALPPRAAAPEGPLTFRPMEVSDAAEMAASLSAPGVVWGTLQVPYTQEAVWRARLAAHAPDRVYDVAVLRGGAFVGSGGLFGSGHWRERHAAMLGMSVSDAVQGQGVGTALLAHLLEAADQWLGLTRVELEVYTDNVRAIALYTRLGFVPEGVLRGEAWREGGYADAQVMARCRF